MKTHPNHTVSAPAPTPEQIERNHQRLVRLRDDSSSLLGDWDTEERARQDAAYQAARLKIARGDDLPLFG